MNLREQLLSHPSVFRALKTLVLPRGSLERMATEYLAVEDGSSVLDLGCGYGDFAHLFATRCDYVGIDHNAAYIDVARARNDGNHAQFYVADVADPMVAEHGPYDLVMMSGVLHHLPSADVIHLSRLIASLLTPSGRFVAIEPVFTSSQGLTARLVIAADRGRHVRDEDGYRRLFESGFAHVQSKVVSGLLRIPYTHVVLTMTV
jgi:SAM-dependent methyltransferase